MLISSTPSLVDTSLRASVVILLLLCLRPALRSWIGSRALAWLWLAVALRLLLPVSAPWRSPSLLVTPATAAASDFIFRVSVSSTDTLANPFAAAKPRPVSPTQPHSRLNLLTQFWLFGVLLTASRLARGWWITRLWASRTCPPDIDSDLQSIYLALPAGLRRGVTLRLTESLDVPALVGILRPQIWLPRHLPATLTSAELRHVLLHELGHARRRDLLSQWLCSLACCLHWFNPLVWLLARLARTDRELACDAWVLSHGTIDSEGIASYGHTLLKVVEGMCRMTPRALPVVSMAAGIRHLALRVREIRAFQPVPPWRGAFALAATTALVAACTLGSAVAGPDTGAVSSTPPPSASAPSSSPPAPAGSPPASPAPLLHAPAPWVPPIQVEIESKFIEVAKSDALQLEKSAPPSSPISSVFHRIFAPLAAHTSQSSPLIFRSSLVLPEEIDLLVRQLNQTKGVDLLSAPRVTTKSEQKATIEITREFIYPTAFQQNKGPFAKPVTVPTNFDKKNTGLTLEVTPTIEPDGKVIDLSLTWTITNFDGFVDADGKPVPTNEEGMPEKMPGVGFPVFDTRSVSTVATLSSGTTVVFSRDEEHLFVRKSLRFAMGETERKPTSAKDDDRLLLIFVKATLVKPPSGPPLKIVDTDDDPSTTDSARPPSQPASSPAAGASPGAATAAPLPYGVPVPGKPGFVTSPYAPDFGYVDVHAFKRGQQVRDPYTGKLFLVP